MSKLKDNPVYGISSIGRLDVMFRKVSGCIHRTHIGALLFEFNQQIRRVS